MELHATFSESHVRAMIGGLRFAEILIIAYFKSYQDNNLPNPTLTALRNEIKMTKSTVNININSLVEKGYLTKNQLYLNSKMIVEVKFPGINVECNNDLTCKVKMSELITYKSLHDQDIMGVWDLKFMLWSKLFFDNLKDVDEPCIKAFTGMMRSRSKARIPELVIPNFKVRALWKKMLGIKELI